SRVEPCGLNQMYAMRYGTVPMVRKTGGLKDTVIDYGEPGGYGITYNNTAVGDITQGIWRATELYYNNKNQLQQMRKQIMQLDFSWETSVQHYIDLYSNLL
ncbi:MAG TPA: glycogen synthase, partial [Chitinophagaceae bacterium]|nr:glycogen synthase [Chitinophagaceae bacterium]